MGAWWYTIYKPSEHRGVVVGRGRRERMGQGHRTAENVHIRERARPVVVDRDLGDEEPVVEIECPRAVREREAHKHRERGVEDSGVSALPRKADRKRPSIRVAGQRPAILHNSGGPEVVRAGALLRMAYASADAASRHHGLVPVCGRPARQRGRRSAGESAITRTTCQHTWAGAC